MAAAAGPAAKAAGQRGVRGVRSVGALGSAVGASARIRVLQLIGNAIVGGMESWVERLIERLPSERFEVTALCPYESPFTDRLRRHGVEVLVVPMPEDPQWSSIQFTSSVIKAAGIELIHAHLPNAHVLGGLAGRLTDTPVLSTIHGRQLTALDLEIHRAVGSYLSVVCRHSYFHALAVGADPQRLSCEPNGVDVQVFQPRAPDSDRPAALRAELGIPADAPLVAYVGRLSPEKGPEVFVRSALLVHARHPRAHCVLFGDGPMEASVRSLVQQLDLAHCVHLAGSRSDMPAVLHGVDITVCSSHSEAMPLALMEAMASGVPVVATRVGGVPEMVEHGHTGWLAERGNFEDIAGRVNALLADEGSRRRMGERARARAVARMNLDGNVARVAQLLARLARPGEVPALATVRSSR
jgi:glycosyltransferase involved in cell wall biosynthesis